MRSIVVVLALTFLPGTTMANTETREGDPSAEEDVLILGHGKVIHDALDAEQTWMSRLMDDSLGIDFGEEAGAWYANVWLRLQTRYSNPFDSDPRTVAAFDDLPGADLGIRRARLKSEGHLFARWFGYYFEHELSGDHPLLDLRLDLTPRDDLRFRVGQYKVLYNRERVDSSGRQQFVERSISTYAFTLDRQRGATVQKHFAPGTRADQWWFIGVMEGDGRDPGPKGDEPMVLARWQWQFLGRALPFQQSDFSFSPLPLASFSLAAATVRGPYTRYSSSGGGQLDGFEAGGDERYTLEQWQQGFAWKFNGWSIQQEYHEKYIDNHETGQRSELNGGYAQLGKAWMINGKTWSKPLELAIRYARVNWRGIPIERDQQEWTMAANLYFQGHDNKLTADVSRIGVDEVGGDAADDIRFRIQWDWSF